LKNKLNQTCIL